MGGSAVRTGAYPSAGRKGADRFPAGTGWFGLGEGVRGQESAPQPALEALGTVAAGPQALKSCQKLRCGAPRRTSPLRVKDPQVWHETNMTKYRTKEMNGKA